MSTNDRAIVAEGLGKDFGSARHPVGVLNGVDLSVSRGEVFALLGPNGAGKTTTVRILTTLLEPDRGLAAVGGHDVVREASTVRELISLTGQHAAVDLKLTGTENLLLMARLVHFSRSASRQRAGDLLDAFGLGDAADRRVATYSGGMRRRLDLAAGLLVRPQVMFLDEPTTGLDPRSRRELWTLIRSVVADGTTVLLTTQYLEEADGLADRIALLDAGRVTAEGTATDLKRRVGTAGVEMTFAEPNEAARAADVLGLVPPVTGENHVRVPTDGSIGQVQAVLATVQTAGLTPADWHVRAPSLDDVFLALTGRAATAADETKEVAA